jgi:hypothetical protein
VVSALILVAFLACLVAALIGISAVAVVSLRLEGQSWRDILGWGWRA